MRGKQADHPARRPLRQIKHAQQRGFAGAARAGQEIEPAGVQRERNVGQRLFARAIAQPDIVELHDFGIWLGHGRGCWFRMKLDGRMCLRAAYASMHVEKRPARQFSPHEAIVSCGSCMLKPCA
jgi:hypothetical protein